MACITDGYGKQQLVCGRMRYTRKVLYVDAVRYTGDNWSEIREFVGFTPLGDVIPTHKFGPIQIRTPNGSVDANPGDWVCRDTMGKYYPCSDDIFRATYYVEDEEYDSKEQER